MKDIIVTVKRLNKEYIITDQNGNRYSIGDHSEEKIVPSWMAKKAVKENIQLRLLINKRGDAEWRRFKEGEDAEMKQTTSERAKELTDENIKPNSPLNMNDAMKFQTSEVPVLDESAKKSNIEIPVEHKEIVAFVNDCYKLKPEGLQMDELQWKYLVRSVLRGENIMMTGASGTGKTISAKAVQAVFDRPKFFINMGATQDPRSSLIGNTHFDKERGTYFTPSYFVQAITTPNAIILLDEVSRSHPDAWNILMSVIDPLQRYLRMDEKDGSPTIEVAQGVTFMSTANIGNEYTSTRTMDKAFVERWTIIEMPVLTKEQEFLLLKYLFPSMKDDDLNSIAAIADATRQEVKTDQPHLTHFLATRASVKMASLMFDGFSLKDSAEVVIYPHYSTDGGGDSERVFMKQIVQKFVPVEKIEGEPDVNDPDVLFSPDEINKATKTP